MEKKVIEELYNKENKLMAELISAEKELKAIQDKVNELKKNKNAVSCILAKGIGARQMVGNATPKQVYFLISLLEEDTGISFNDYILKKLSMVEAQVLIKELKAESDLAKGKITQEEYDEEISDEFYRYFQLVFGKINKLQECHDKAAERHRVKESEEAGVKPTKVKKYRTYAERIRAHIEESKS